MDAETYRLDIEQKILDIMVVKLQRGEMTAERARDIARMVLDKLHPPLSLEQIYEIVPTLDDEFTELASLVLSLTKDQQKEESQIVAQHAEQLIKQGKFEQAKSMIVEALH